MKSYLSFFKNGRFQAALVSAGATALFITAAVSAATTISTNISTGGTLAVTGASTLTGNVTASGDLAVTGNATTTGAHRITGLFNVNGNATTTSAGNISTQGTLTVGSGNTAHVGFLSGTCNIVQRSLTASTTGGFACTGATGVTTSFKVFVMATSTLSGGLANQFGGFSVQAASSTAAATIGVQISNLTGDTNTPAGTLNFWAVQ